MLKISQIDGTKRRRLIVEGKLTAPWAAELIRACEQAKTDLHGRELVVEMKQVHAISQDGENVILDLLNRGIRFRSDGMFTKHILRQLTRRAYGNREERNR